MTEEKKDIFDRLMHLPVFRIFEPFYKKNKEVLMYLLFGGLTTVVSIGVYSLCIYGLHMDALIANVISWICAVTFAYVTNRIWVFTSKVHGRFNIFKEVAAFFGGRIFSLVFEEIVLYICINLLHGNDIIVKIGAQIGVLILNYLISKFVVFKKK